MLREGNSIAFNNKSTYTCTIHLSILLKEYKPYCCKVLLAKLELVTKMDWCLILLYTKKVLEQRNKWVRPLIQLSILSRRSLMTL